MTKKLQFYTVALCLSLFGLINTISAATTFTLTTGADATVNTNWGKVGSSSTHPTATFNGANAIYQLSGAQNPNVTLAHNWTVTGGNSYVVILSGVTFSDGGHNFNAGVSGSGSATTFSVASGATANISGAGDITGVYSYGTINLSGTAIFENTDVESGGLLSVSGAATLNGVNPIAGTLTISNASATIANITAATGGAVNLNAAVHLTSLTANSGSTVNFNAAAVIASSLTSLSGSTVVYNSAGISVFPTTYNGNVTISSTAHLTLNTTVNGVLTLNAVLTLNSNQLSLGGTLAGASTITGDNAASLVITSSTAVFGTLNFTGGSQTLDVFDMSSAGASCTVTLGTNLTITDAGDASSLLDLSGGILNLNGHTLTSDNTCVNLNLGGTITGSTTSALQLNLADASTFISYNSGSLMMDQTTDGSTNALSNLTFNDGGNGLTLALGNNLDIIDSLSPTSGTVDASSGGLILIADQATVGHVGRIGLVGGAINGNITSQVYHDPAGNQTNWVVMGVAGISNTSFSDWNNTFKITCASCADGDGSAQNSGTPFTSIDLYDETQGTGDPNAAAHYVGINSNTDAISPGVGYWVYMGASQPATSTAAELISAIGTAKTGGAPWSLTNSNGGAATDGYNLLANPYPSPISWSKVATRNSNMITTYYAWNSVTQDYSIYNTVTGSNTSGSYVLTDVIPAGLGFYVQSLTAGTTAFDLQEQDKTAGNQLIGKMANPNNSVQSIASYFSLMIDGTSSTNHQEATISFNPNSIAGLDGFDAVAFPWNGVLQITTTGLGNTFAINSLPALTQNYSIPVKILSGTTMQYTISAKNLQNLPAGACVKLHDNYGVMADQDLRGGAFTVTVNDSETVARFVLNVTISPLMINTNAVNASCHATNDGLITVVGNDAGPWNYIWKDANGTVVKTSLNKTTADTLTGLNNGVYTVDVTTVGSCNSATQTFTITAPAASTSAFTASSQVNVGDNVVLTNTSANATNYVWNFGDGNISSMQTPTYAYNNAGTYTITLQAINANCNDTASSTQVITVNATTGIKQANTGDGDINISRDGAGNYIQFDYTNQTKVNITVYNVLGQTLLNNAALSVVNDKIYINVTDNKNQVLYVTITELNTNKQTTKKFVND